MSDPLTLAHWLAEIDRCDRHLFLLNISLSQHVDRMREFGEPDAFDYETSANACRKLCEIPSLVWC